MTAELTLPRFAIARRDDGWHVVDTASGASHGTYPASSSGATAAQTAADGFNRTANGEASQIRAWRKAHKLSQGGLGKLLGVTWLTVQRWEAGTQSYPPYLELALKYLDLESHP
jgi:DNA-binding transcriptional regulator YiaG